MNVLLSPCAAGVNPLSHLGASVAVLALICLACWATVRFLGPQIRRANGQRRMKVVEKLSLDPKRALYLVQVDGKELIVGAGEKGLHTLKELDQGSDPDAR